AHRHAFGGAGGVADVGRGTELHAFCFHLREATVDQYLVQLEVRNAIAQESAHAVALVEQRDAVSRPRQLLCAGQAGRPGTHDGDLLAGAAARRLRDHPAFVPATINDGVFDRLDADGIVVDVEGTGRFARCRTDAAGELGEIIG